MGTPDSTLFEGDAEQTSINNTVGLRSISIEPWVLHTRVAGSARW